MDLGAVASRPRRAPSGRQSRRPEKHPPREKSEGDEYLRETYGGERGPPFNKAFDPSADEK